MAILGAGLNIKFTEFKEFKDVVENIINVEASLDKKRVRQENKEAVPQSSISIDVSNRIYLNLKTGEKIKSILYIDNQKSTDRYIPQNCVSPENLNRYHLYRCPMVDNIFMQNSKFSVTARSDNLFKYSFFNDIGELLYETNSQQLTVCRTCLTEFNLIHGTNYSVFDFYPSIYLSILD